MPFLPPNQKYQSTKGQRGNHHTQTDTFNGPFSATTQVSQYQKGKTNPDFTEARDTQLFTGRMPFVPPNQQRQSTEDT